MSDTNQSFHYSALDTNRREIRLVVIGPALSQNEELICRLTTTHLYDSTNASSSAFEALSYTWGTDDAEFPVQIDGFAFLVRPNLDRALRVLRQPLRATRVWIDAICINQNDVDERNEHVRYMHQVYHKASQVLIWLGDAGGDSDWLFTQVNRVDEEIHTIWETLGETSSDSVSSDPSKSHLWKVLHDTDRLGAALSQLAERPWWQRAWTLQEFVCADSSPVFLCGSLRLSLPALRRILYLLVVKDPATMERRSLVTDKLNLPRIHTTLDLNYLTRSKNLYQTYLDANSSSENTHERLVQALVKVRKRKATDARDKVFALLNLIPPAEWPPGQPDYRKSTASVYAETARFIIEKSRRLTLLALCEPPASLDADDAAPGGELASSTNATPGLPSWAPDWTRARTSGPLLREYEDHKEANEGFSELLEPLANPFKAANGTDAFAKFSEDSMHLTVKGVVTDRVVANVTVLPSVVEEEIFQIPHIYKVLTAILSDQGVADPAQFGCSSYLELLWWTMTGKQSPRDGEATLEHYKDFEEWINSAGSQGDSHMVTFSIMKNSPGRRFFVTSKGFFGSGPRETDMGDYICVLLGSAVPLIVRQVPRASDIWKSQHSQKAANRGFPLSEWCSAPDANMMNLVVGESYIHGIMDGQVIKSVHEGQATLEEISLS